MEPLENLTNDLANAIEITLSPTVSQDLRLEALNACERFKETSPCCSEAGFFLATSTKWSKMVQHFGLHLIEHTIKYRWNQIGQQEKIFIKENAMKILISGNNSEQFLKDAISRIIVEMIKREWPQQWQSLLVELGDACRFGEIQTEIVLLIFLRLAEDVAVLQTLESNQRRKDIYQGLTSNMSLIFTFFLQLLETHIRAFQEALPNSEKYKANRNVVVGILQTLCGFVEWAPYVHFLDRNGRLLQIILMLLTHKDFELSAAECLLLIVNRKGKISERKSLKDEIFSESNMQYIIQASKKPQPLQEDDYTFLKKFVQILVGLCSQLCFLWGKESDIMSRPVTFSHFLDTVFEVCQYQSLVLIHLANPIWVSMLKCDQINRDQLLLSMIPKWLQFMGPKLIKSNFSSSPYAVYEFDSDDDYSAFFWRFRADVLESFRCATTAAPLVTFQYAEQWLRICLSDKSVGINNWDALSFLLDSVLSRILQVTERPSIINGLNLLEQCIQYETTDPDVLSNLLSCISALFVFLSMASGHMAPAANSVALAGAALLPKVLEKIFSVLLVTTNDVINVLNRPKAIKDLRTHSTSLMLKLGVKYPLLLLPLFDHIQFTIQNLCADNSPAQLSISEKVALQEFMLLISNHICDYEKQSKFVGEIFKEANIQWLTLAQLGIFEKASDFIRLFQFDKNIGDPMNDNRSKLSFCVSLLLGIVRRCSVPDDPERAARGGFVMGSTDSGNPVCRNPATPHIVPILPHFLGLVRVFNEIFNPESQQLISSDLRNCLQMSELEKNQILNNLTNQNFDPKPPQQQLEATLNNDKITFEKTQRFQSTLYEHCYHLLGSLGPSLGRDLFQLDGLGNAIVGSVLSNLDYVPDFRIRNIIRVFFKSFAHSCPPSFYKSVLLPIMAHLAPIMLMRLTKKWQQIYDSKLNTNQDEQMEIAELIDDNIIRSLTREYLEVLKIILIGGAITESQEYEELAMDMDGPPAPTRSMLTNEVVTELGTILLQNDLTYKSIVLTVLGSLSWIDSLACLKATVLLNPIVKLLVSDNLLSSDMSVHIMRSIIQALTIHGQHEGNQGVLLTIGAQMYEILRPKYPEIMTIINQIPGVNPVDIQKLDERVAVSTSKGNKVEKLKRDLFKKIINPLIGKNVSQLFRKEISINDLPRTNSAKNKKNNPICETNLSNFL